VLNFLLFYRLVIFNVLGIAIVIWAYLAGYVTLILERDATGVVYGIIALGVVGIISTLSRGWKISTKINNLKAGKYVDILKAKKMPHKNEHIHDIAGWALLVGIFGNTLGFIMALASKDTLLAGASTAFASTTVGILVALWIEGNFRMIKTQTALLLEDINGENR
jgi:hypothetical protein